MPRQNRVTPLGELIAAPDRGLVYGNRGCLHDAAGQIRRAYNGRRWIACRLRFRGWQRSPLMQPGRFTELFFLDEATALAAGHRPCALCRREDYNRLTSIWRELHPGERGSDEIDHRLHRERLQSPRERRLHELWVDELPDGAFVRHDQAPYVVRGPQLLAWTPAGYVNQIGRPHGERVTVITPPSLLALLRAGWEPVVPLLHPTATAAAPPTK
jgi:hypothetical protein